MLCMANDVHRTHLLALDSLPDAQDDNTALHLPATHMAMDVLGELLMFQLQQNILEGASYACELIETRNVGLMLDSISECLWQLKPIVDRLLYITDNHGLQRLHGMDTELRMCMKKASAVFQLYTFLFNSFYTSNGLAVPMELTIYQINMLSVQGFSMRPIMDYIFMIAHHFGVNMYI
jgi:hypothetical protein